MNRQHCVNGLALNDTTGMNLLTFRPFYPFGLTVTYRGNFQLCKGAARHRNDMVWIGSIAFLPQCLFQEFLPTFAAPRGGGGVSTL